MAASTEPNGLPQPPLPRLLCLHGGATNARVLSLQMRSLIRELAAHFRFVFADAPFISLNPHPALLKTVYMECGPFRNWFSWLPEHHRGVDEDCEAAEVAYTVRRAMEEDDRVCDVEGRGRGKWVGVLGFSQGARVAASLLGESEQLMRLRELGRVEEVGNDVGLFRFAVVMAGQGPLVRLNDKTAATPDDTNDARVEKLKSLTLHVHGLADPGLEKHRAMIETWCEPGTAKVVEWEGDHRLPLKTAEVEKVAEAILEVARDALRD